MRLIVRMRFRSLDHEEKWGSKHQAEAQLLLMKLSREILLHVYSEIVGALPWYKVIFAHYEDNSGALLLLLSLSLLRPSLSKQKSSVLH